MIELNSVIHGDCLEVMKSIPDKSIDMVLTDPPYNANYGFENDNLLDSDFLFFCEKWIAECERISNIQIYIVDPKYCLNFYKIPKSKYHHTYVHYKNNAMRGMLGGFANTTFIIVYNPKNIYKNHKYPNDVWNIPLIPQNIEHPTPKSVLLLNLILKKFSNENDTILDCFAGSGTTGIACLELNRNYILIEKEKKYVDIINQRIENYKLQGKLF